MKKFAVILALTLISCKSTYHVERLVNQVKNNPQQLDKVIIETENAHRAIKQDIAQVKQALDSLQQLVEAIWGKSNTELPSSKKYVKYSNDYQARAIVDFNTGQVTVETIAKKQPKATLQQALVLTLLTPADPSRNDIFSSAAPKLGTQPFLYNQVLDQDNKAIRYQWRANRFAQHLIANNLRIKSGIHQVSFSLEQNHQHLRKQQYSNYVLASAKRYRIAPDLIYAIIETESNFNPYAVSHANAYGLMQVVPATAGKDVYQKVKNRQGQPSKAQLFNAKNNIDIGTAYLHLLQSRYLKSINHPTNKHYAMISAYNGGTGNVLKTFDINRERAFREINQLTPKSLYWALTKKHPKQESRQYLQKVTKNQKKYL